MIASSLLCNPFVLFLTQRITIALLAAFSHPTSYLRPLIFPIFIAWNIYLFPYYKNYSPTLLSLSLVCFETLGQIPTYAEQILLKQWTLDTFGPAKYNAENSSDERTPRLKSPSSHSSWERLRFGTWLAFSTRYISTPHQATNTPPYSTRDPTYIPTRTSFIARKLLIFAISYLSLDILAQGSQPELNPIRFADAKIPLFTRLPFYQHDPSSTISAEELLLRVSTSLSAWVGSYIVIQLAYGTPQILTVALGLSSPAQERPLFGSIGEVYTLRGFWGSFWHQMLRCRLTAIADWVTYDVLRLPQSGTVRGRRGGERVSYGRLVARYTHLMCVFGLSGLVHHYIDVVDGREWSGSGAIQGFSLMGVGVVAEDAVQWVWFDVLGDRGLVGGSSGSTKEGDGQKRRQGTWATRVVGYLWVVTWLSVATPWYLYPNLSRDTGGERHEMLPFSVIRYLRTR
ncbi:MAG: hypothetical protein Q9195_005798 [Heterodermia aff. obscurata]